MDSHPLTRRERAAAKVALTRALKVPEQPSTTAEARRWAVCAAIGDYPHPHVAFGFLAEAEAEVWQQTNVALTPTEAGTPLRGWTPLNLDYASLLDATGSRDHDLAAIAAYGCGFWPRKHDGRVRWANYDGRIVAALPTIRFHHVVWNEVEFWPREPEELDDIKR